MIVAHTVKRTRKIWDRGRLHRMRRPTYNGGVEQHSTPGADEITAAIAAIRLMLGEDDAVAQEERAGWIASARLITQRIPPRRVHTPPSWSTVERLRRDSASSFLGITGL